MIFVPAPLDGAFLIEPEKIEDERGFFARIWCAEEFKARGLDADLSQCSISFNKREGTLRGMHFQASPWAETKLVRCTQGRIYDVIIDLRAESPTFRRWAAFELSAENRKTLYVPKGFAHGFQSLTDGAEVLYQISEVYHPEAARGVRWDDPAFAIDWPPTARRVIAPRDRSWPDFPTGIADLGSSIRKTS